MSDISWSIDTDIQNYLYQINPIELEILQKLRAETRLLRQGDMAIAKEQAQWLTWLANLINVKNYLEVGVFTGYSSLAMALSMPNDGHITACDISVTFTDIAKRYWQEANIAHKISLHLQPALITLKELIDQGLQNHYDFALIDADKPTTADYFEACLVLIRVGGVIAIDNVLLHGRVMHTTEYSCEQAISIKAMEEFNASLKSDNRIRPLTLPIGDGLTLIQKIG